MNSRKDSSPRLSSSGGEDVFDFPGVEDESNGSGPPSREAHAALREGINIKCRKIKIILLHSLKNAWLQYSRLNVCFEAQ